MIEVLNDIAEDVVGFRLSGEVSGEDYEKVLIPALKSKLKEQGKLKVLYQVSEDFDSYDFSALLDDAKAGFMFYTAWEKIAVISDIEWIINSVKVFSFTVPAKIKTFENKELQKAKEWLMQKDKSEPNIKISLDKKSKIAILEPFCALSQRDFLKAKELIDPFIKENGKLNGIIIHTKDFPGWDSSGAFFAHMRFIKEHQKHVKKIAFATDSLLIETGDKIASYFIDTKIKNFHFNELKKAKEWIEG
ncbi:MAG: STAS/SEC14 domain-containing protein [Epsilonproteobacteria bacterium]|nr:STAS/SEC14 domain-containing protein [Campylobacterota bacterium]